MFPCISLSLGCSFQWFQLLRRACFQLCTYPRPKPEGAFQLLFVRIETFLIFSSFSSSVITIIIFQTTACNALPCFLGPTTPFDSASVDAMKKGVNESWMIVL